MYCTEILVLALIASEKCRVNEAHFSFQRKIRKQGRQVISINISVEVYQTERVADHSPSFKTADMKNKTKRDKYRERGVNGAKWKRKKWSV